MSEATWKAALGCARRSLNAVISATRSGLPARALRTSSLVIGSPSSGTCWVRPLGNSSASSAARQPRPGAHAVRVEMHEGRRRGRVVADAAALADQGGVAQLLHRNVGKGHVGGLAQDMAALAGLPAHGLAQHLVGRLRAIAGDDVDGLGRPQLVVDLPEQVDELGIHLRLLVLAPVAQDPVDVLHRLGDALAVLHVLDGQRLLGVDVVERDGAVARVVGRDARRPGREREQGCGNATGDAAATRWQVSFPPPTAAGVRARERLAVARPFVWVRRPPSGCHQPVNNAEESHSSLALRQDRGGGDIQIAGARPVGEISARTRAAPNPS